MSFSKNKNNFHNGRTKNGDAIDKLTMLRVDADVIAGFLTEASAIEEFNKISTMNPIWSGQHAKGEYYISARMGFEYTEGKPRKDNLGFNQSADPNALIHKKFNKLITATADSGMVIKVETGVMRAKHFVYDAKKGDFVPVQKI